MKVVVDGQAYDVRFSYKTGTKEGKANINPNRRVVTKCRISKINESEKGKNRYCEVSTGWTIRSWDDKFNKKEGRKIALKRALETLDKKTRTEFWKAYAKEMGLTKDKVCECGKCCSK